MYAAPSNSPNGGGQLLLVSNGGAQNSLVIDLYHIIFTYVNLLLMQSYER